MIDPIDQALHALFRELLLLHDAADKHVLAQHGLRRARYFVLHHLYHEAGLTLGQLSELTLIYSASASRIVYSMEQEGLVQRVVNESDRRLFTLSLTEKGRRFYEQVSADLAADVQARYQGLDAGAKLALLEDSRRLRDMLREHCRWQVESGAASASG